MSEYWTERFRAVAQSLMEKGDNYFKDLSDEFEKATKNIEDDLSKFYGRYAQNNQISFSEAKRLLTLEEIKKFKIDVNDYIKMAQQTEGMDEQWLKQLENYSLMYRISRLKMLQIQVEQHLQQLAASYSTGFHKTLSDIFTTGYYQTGYEVFAGTGIATTFERFDQKAVDVILSKPWSIDGKTFSDRVWSNQQLLTGQLQTTLTQGFVRGDSIDKMVKNLRDKIQTSKYNANRVIRTESNFVANEALYKGFKQSGVEQYQLDAVLDLKTSDICQEIDQRIFKLSEKETGVTYPPFHPHCRTSAVPYYEDDEPGERFARDKDGKGIYIPGTMKYKEWKETYIK